MTCTNFTNCHQSIDHNNPTVKLIYSNYTYSYNFCSNECLVAWLLQNAVTAKFNPNGLNIPSSKM